MKKLAAIFLLLVTSAHAAPDNPALKDKHMTAAVASHHFCVKAIKQNLDQEQNAIAQGQVKLPAEMAKNFTKAESDATIFMLYPGEVLLKTTKRPLCQVLVRTLDPKQFEEKIRFVYEKKNVFVQEPNSKTYERPGETLLTFRDTISDTMIMVSFSPQEKPDGMQGLITVGKLFESDK